MKYKLSVAAIAKNEHFGLVEWVNYHRVVGVEHFYVYDNDSQVPVSETLAKYIEAGIVTCIKFPGLSRQMPSYNHCLEHFGKDSQWIAFIDCDEFLLPKQGDSVPNILDQFQSFGGLGVNWILFGSNGHIKRPDGLVIENYTQATLPEHGENLHIKSIVQPQYTIKAGGNPHHFIYKPGYTCVSETEEIVPNAWTRVQSSNLLQLNHYTCKSVEDWHMKLSKGRADAFHLPPRGVEDIAKIDSFCVVENTDILRFAEQTKKLFL